MPQCFSDLCLPAPVQFSIISFWSFLWLASEQEKKLVVYHFNLFLQQDSRVVFLLFRSQFNTITLKLLDFSGIVCREFFFIKHLFLKCIVWVTGGSDANFLNFWGKKIDFQKVGMVFWKNIHPWFFLTFITMVVKQESFSSFEQVIFFVR